MPQATRNPATTWLCGESVGRSVAGRKVIDSAGESSGECSVLNWNLQLINRSSTFPSEHSLESQTRHISQIKWPPRNPAHWTRDPSPPPCPHSQEPNQQESSSPGPTKKAKQESNRHAGDERNLERHPRENEFMPDDMISPFESYAQDRHESRQLSNDKSYQKAAQLQVNSMLNTQARDENKSL